MSTSTPPAPSRILALPGELKNRVYRLVLLSAEIIDVEDEGYDRPALMSTCKEIRADTIKIYYEESKFKIRVRNLNSDPMLKRQESLRSVCSGVGTIWAVRVTSTRCSLGYVHGSGMCWSNHREHLRRIHAAELDEMVEHAGDFPPDERTIGNFANLLGANMFCLAKSLRKEPWHVAEKAMLDLRAVMNALGHHFDDE